MRTSWWNRLVPNSKSKRPSWLRSVVAGSLYRVSDMRSSTSLEDIKTQIETMRALARDSQVSTALSYYATDCTVTNSAGQIIWATPIDKAHADVADVINSLFKRWSINSYVRDHILELATIGNLYIPTTALFREAKSSGPSRVNVGLDFNSIADDNFDIIPSTKLRPEDIVHLWYQGKPSGYIYQPDGDYNLYPESSIIHFSLGGLLGEYTIDARDKDNNIKTYDIQFADPLFQSAAQPTQTLSLLEDANVLASLVRVVKFINVDCSDAEDDNEIIDTLQQIKDKIEQQLALNTVSGDTQSFINPQSPNNLIYLPKVNGQDPISVTDLNMAETNAEDNKLLEYYLNKKLSVLGVPKEMFNFSSNEGLGGAGSVLSQRSAIYSNGLQRLMTAYKTGWTQALNTYFISRNMSGFVDKFVLNMNPIITPLAAVQADRRDAAINQASSLVQLLRDLRVSNENTYLKSIVEILSDVFPTMSADAASWNIDINNEGDAGNEI